MSLRRRSTVHDLAALRLHRDNSRVLNSETNLSSRRAKYSLRDARGNWIAQDAGGLGKVNKRRSASEPHDGGDLSQSEEDGQNAPQSSRTRGRSKGHAQERGSDDGGSPLRTRSQKRRHFDEDMRYLETESPSMSAFPSTDGHIALLAEDLPGSLPTPSSDLLKCLHHFASSYYTAMGQLYDATREARQQRKTRRLAKYTANDTASSSRAASSEATKVAVYREDSDHETTESSEEDDEAAFEAESPKDKKSGTKRKRRVEKHPMNKDMYKIFDGSALVALGMLLQEHVTHSLDSHVPNGWEKEMELIERNRRKDERKSRQAQRMREMRHPVKVEQTGMDEPESEDEPENDIREHVVNRAGGETDEED